MSKWNSADDLPINKEILIYTIYDLYAIIIIKSDGSISHNHRFLIELEDIALWMEIPDAG